MRYFRALLDTVRRRVQNEQLGHRGRKRDPLYTIRKILLSGSERVVDDGANRMLLGLRVGDPNDEVLGAWLAKESVRDVYLTDDPSEAAVLLDKTIAGCRSDTVPEIRSLGATLARWRTEILAHHDTGASNGPTEGLNLLVKEVKRCGRGFENFEHYGPVKPDETTCHADLMSASAVGSLIQATVGSFGGWGRRCPNRAGLVA
jgi:transposase